MVIAPRINIVFIWPPTDELQAYFHSELDDLADLQFVDSRDQAESESMAQDADIIVGWAVRESLLEKAVKARLVIIPAIGVDRHVPILQKFPHIVSLNSRGNAVPTAQHAVALLLAVTNHVLHFDARMRTGQWRAFDDDPASVLLENVPVGLLGTGTVGKEILKRLSGFGCQLSCCSRRGHALSEFPNIPVFPVDKLHPFLESIQVLLIAVPSTPQTTGLIGPDEIDCLPATGILVNVARGSVVDEKALFEALRDQRLMAAGIDVWYNYQPESVDGKRFPYTYPFHELPNIVLSPHRGGSPLKRPDRYIDVVDNIRRFIRGEPLTNRIDLNRGY